MSERGSTRHSARRRRAGGRGRVIDCGVRRSRPGPDEWRQMEPAAEGEPNPDGMTTSTRSSCDLCSPCRCVRARSPGPHPPARSRPRGTRRDRCWSGSRRCPRRASSTPCRACGRHSGAVTKRVPCPTSPAPSPRQRLPRQAKGRRRSNRPRRPRKRRPTIPRSSVASSASRSPGVSVAVGVTIEAVRFIRRRF